MIFSGVVFDHPYGYRTSPIIPILRGEDFCPHCFFVPCIIFRPQIIFVGCVVPILQTMKKDITSIKKFWRTLKELNLWNHEEYLQRKEERTVRDDKRDIIPNCIITVSFFLYNHFIYIYIELFM